MDNIKEAFLRVKEDIFALGNEMNKIKLGLGELKSELRILTQFTDDLRVKMMNFDEKVKNSDFQSSKNQQFIAPNPSINPNLTSQTQKIPQNTPTDTVNKPTNPQITSAYDSIPTDKLLSQVLKRQNSSVSICNGGVPTDRQTNQQTDRHIPQHTNIEEKPAFNPVQTTKESHYKEDINHLEKVSEILSNLDNLKKDIRRKFKALTAQEITVFSAIYTLGEQEEVSYTKLATTLKLSESSIRDYVGKIQKKGIPIIKEKLNNKLVVLKISPELKKVASLDTILKLREI